MKKVISIITGTRAFDVVGVSDSFGRTPLHYLCRYKENDLEDLLKLYIHKVSDLEKSCSRGYTPLLMLCEEPNPPALKVLLSFNADSTSPRTRFTGSSPLLLACCELRRSSLRNSPASRLHAVTVSMLAYHIDFHLGLSLNADEEDMKGESLMTVIKSSSASHSAVLSGLTKSFDQRTAVRKHIRTVFKQGYAVLYDIISSYIIPTSCNAQLMEDMLKNQRSRPTIRKSMSLPSKSLNPKPSFTRMNSSIKTASTKLPRRSSSSASSRSASTSRSNSRSSNSIHTTTTTTTTAVSSSHTNTPPARRRPSVASPSPSSSSSSLHHPPHHSSTANGSPRHYLTRRRSIS
jgi:hypothetical protein